MAVIKLTYKDTPPRPVYVNPDHVASMLPLRSLVPSPNTQTPGAVEQRYTGTKIVMADGTQYNVNELPGEVEALMDVVVDAKEDLTQGRIPPSQLPSLDLRDDKADQEFLTGLKEVGVPVTGGLAEDAAPGPAKKAPAKKAAAKKAEGTDIQAELDKGVQTAQKTAEALGQAEDQTDEQT